MLQGHSRLVRVAIGPVLVVAVLALASACIGPGFRGPVAPYDHNGFAEVSAATEDVVAGQASTVVDGLREHGYWCVQPRSNDRAVQIACRSPERDIAVDLVAAPDGDVLYADIDLEAGAVPDSSADSRDRLDEVLDASLLLLWPQDHASIRDLVESAQPQEFLPMGGAAPPANPDEQYSTQNLSTGDADWSLRVFYTGEPLALRVRTAGLEDHSWPLDGSHYATSTNAATTELLADGFTCATACHRAPDEQTVAFESHQGQIVVARLTMRSSVEGPRADLPGAWTLADLPFLTPEVRGAIEQRVEESRIHRQSWRGVVEGTPLDVRAVPGGATTPDGQPLSDLEVTIGLPLFPVE